MAEETHNITSPAELVALATQWKASPDMTERNQHIHFSPMSLLSDTAIQLLASGQFAETPDSVSDPNVSSAGRPLQTSVMFQMWRTAWIQLPTQRLHTLTFDAALPTGEGSRFRWSTDSRAARGDLLADPMKFGEFVYSMAMAMNVMSGRQVRFRVAYEKDAGVDVRAFENLAKNLESAGPQS